MRCELKERNKNKKMLLRMQVRQQRHVRLSTADLLLLRSIRHEVACNIWELLRGEIACEA